MKKLIILLLFPVVCFAQYPLQRNMSIPRGDARTIEFTTDNNLTGDSIVFTMSLYYQETYMNSTNNALRLGNWRAFGGSATQVLAYDSTGGKIRVYVTMANTLGLTERQYFYSLRVNDTSKYYGTITMVPTVFTTSWLTYLTNNDTTKFVSRTNPVIPGFSIADLADTNKVLAFDMTGKMVLRWKGSGGASTTVTDTLNANVVRANPSMIPFTPRTAPAHTEGRVWYDSDNDALSVYNAEADVTLQVGEEEWVYARNNTGATITNGSVVYISGAIGQNPTIALARADVEATSCVIGVATHDIEINTNGYVTTHGLVRNLNLTNYGDGSRVWLSADSAGHFTLNKPTSTAHRKIVVGHIAYSHGTLGKLLVQIREPSDLDRLNGFANADSVHSVLDTVGNFALSVAQSAAVEADTAGNFALSVAQGATVTANAALPKSDTTALHAQKFKDLENSIGGKGDSDSLSTTTATANAALPKADTTALHAQKLKDLEDKIAARRDSTTINGTKAPSFILNGLVMDSTSTYWQKQDSSWSHRDSVSFLTPTIPGLAYRFAEVSYILFGRSTYSLAWSINTDSANGVRLQDVTIEVRSFRNPLLASFGTTSPYKVVWEQNGTGLNNAGGTALDISVPIANRYVPYATMTVDSYSMIMQAITDAGSQACLMVVRIRCVIPSTSTSLYYARINGF